MSEIPETQVYPIIWQGDHVLLIDQNRLPADYTLVSISRSEDMVTAIKTLIVRGAPAIGIAAAYGLYLGAREIPTRDRQAFLERLEAVAEQLKETRPDKANLAWAIDRLMKKARNTLGAVEYLKQTLLESAQALQQADLQTCYAIGHHGLQALPSTPQQLAVYTHCNHGALAASGYGTSLGVVRAAWHQGRLSRVYAGETRPRLQGARLTAWECVQDGIPVTIVADCMAAHCMQQGLVQAVLVGADRIALNGDTINKVGTYGLALLAKAHQIPFFVAAPLATVDSQLPSGAAVTVEENPAADIYQIGETVIAPEGASFYNPAADVTPAELITAIVTEQGAIAPTELSTLISNAS
ncbi:S-methyl-5-thioribose-1-phosphate isomerase [Almyronema epifaneia]|uniref:Methylthioribose-1-phosphate isomerase n=1 Tax=Almyronema epifaneia S1 TaxID=2991925 RepID=A0ABW6IHM2_9CYAN